METVDGAATDPEPAAPARLLLTPLEAAKVLGVGRTKLYELLTDGQLESVRIGVCRRIAVEALVAYVARLRTHQG